ncbi:hypothetical protein EVAR_41561_1 [Eumeta japonica]|uniref:Uncharacterized protein n=1 Tax=Eumeta variegata TaxID=151549 RepID=A0A4C1Y0A4_EUMVA|nr:hypothetical protein EVAR_41561_1 [Eumeta japonica]
MLTGLCYIFQLEGVAVQAIKTHITRQCKLEGRGAPTQADTTALLVIEMWSLDAVVTRQFCHIKVEVIKKIGDANQAFEEKAFEWSAQ